MSTAAEPQVSGEANSGPFIASPPELMSGHDFGFNVASILLFVEACGLSAACSRWGSSRPYRMASMVTITCFAPADHRP